MARDFNIAPYYDDFDEFKNFHQILFRPGFAVQARELTQLQSVLKNQIEKFGNHIFQQGSIVIPGNSRAELVNPYIKINSTYNSVAIDYSYWENKTIVGVNSGVRAIVKKSIPAEASDPITFYLSYISGGIIGGVSTNKIVFDIGEDIQVETDSTKLATIQSDTSSVGAGSLAHINSGVYYVNGTFASVERQTIVISKYTSTPSCRVLLRIDETIVTSEGDASLLDPAQGSYNFSAPGADRYKLSLTLTSLPLTSSVTDDYIEIMRYNEGVLEQHARTPRYSELDKYIARRTFDESGNYVVSGFKTDIKEHKKVSNNLGLSPSGDINNYAVTVYPGKAYINGFEVEKIASTNIIAPKARTDGTGDSLNHVKLKEFRMSPVFGRYIYVSNMQGGVSLSSRQVIDFYNDDDAGNMSATKVATARVLAIDYFKGDPDSTNAIHKLWITDLQFESSAYTLEDAGGIRYTNGNASVVQILIAPLTSGTHNIGDIIEYGTSERTALVKYWDPTEGQLFVVKNDATKLAPKVGELIVNTTTSASSVVQNKVVYSGSSFNTTIFRLPVSFVKSLRNESNVFDIEYTVQKEIIISTDVNGDGSQSIGSGEILTPEAGTFIAIGPAGIVPISKFTKTAANTITVDNGPANSTIRIYASVLKQGNSPRTKTLTIITNESVTLTSGKAILANSDIYSITNVISSIDGDVTDRFTFDNGQRDHAYYLGTINLKSGQSAPTGTLTVSYKYFQHTSGDFFTLDSYALNAGYQDFTLNYVSSGNGLTFNLKNCIDCRPTVNSSDDFGAGALVPDLIVTNTSVKSTIQYYVPRYDLLVINKDGDSQIINGIPNETPIVPSVPVDTIPIETYFVQAYTDSIVNIRKRRVAIDRMTMSDLRQLSNKVSRIEEFSVLNATENRLLNYNIIDAETGLDRYKTGYVVETFDTPLTISRSRYTSSYFNSTFDQGNLKPAIDQLVCPAYFQDTSSNYLFSNGLITLPYTEEVFIDQSFSSRVTNLNPFLVIKWDGILEIVPESDSWIEIQDLPEVFESRTEEVPVYVYASCPEPDPGPTVPIIDMSPAYIPGGQFWPGGNSGSGSHPTPAPSNVPATPAPVIVPPVSGGGDGGWDMGDSPVPGGYNPNTDLGFGFGFSGQVSTIGQDVPAFSLDPIGLAPVSDAVASPVSATDNAIADAQAQGLDDTAVAAAAVAVSNANAASGDGPGDGDGCFTAETLITMADGSQKKICDVRVGEFVFNYNLTRINQVKFIERPSGTHWKYLYSPSADIAPFATNNHPLIINDKMLALNADEVRNLYPWLSISDDIENAITTNNDADIVYNLWVDGDSTYRVYDYGTTSIIGDGGLLRRLWEKNKLSEDRVVYLMQFFTSMNNYITHGSYIINKVRFLDYPMSKILATDTGCRALIPLMSAVGRICSLFKSK